MAPFLDLEHGVGIDFRPRVVPLDGELGETGVMVELGERGTCRGKRRLLGKHVFSERGEQLKLQRQRPLGGGGDARFKLRQLRRGEAHGVGQRLAVNEALGVGRLAQACGVARGDLDEIAKNIVVAHFERLDAGCFRIVRLECGDVLAAAVAKLTLFVEIGAEARANEAAVALVEGKLIGKRSRKRGLDLCRRVIQPVGDVLKCLRQP